MVNNHASAAGKGVSDAHSRSPRLYKLVERGTEFWAFGPLGSFLIFGVFVDWVFGRGKGWKEEREV